MRKNDDALDSKGMCSLSNNLHVLILKDTHSKYFGQDFWDRAKYRAEFIERNPEFQTFLSELMEFDFEKRDNKRTFQRLLDLGRRLFPEDPILASGILRLPSESLAKDIALQSIASIEILNKENKPSRSRYLEYHRLDGIWEIELKTMGKILRPLATDAIDHEHKTITIKIHLDRQREDIKRDIIYLLDILGRESKLFGIDLGKTKRPQFDVYDKFLKVYDLKKDHPKKEWSEIAKEVFPEDVKPHRAPHRRTRKNELPPRETIDKVRHYWRQAKEMIEKGGWKQI